MFGKGFELQFGLQKTWTGSLDLISSADLTPATCHTLLIPLNLVCESAEADAAGSEAENTALPLDVTVTAKIYTSRTVVLMFLVFV